MQEGFFKSDTINALELEMNRMLKLMGESHYEGDNVAVQYFKSEYKRLAEIHRKEIEDWLAIW